MADRSLLLLERAAQRVERDQRRLDWLEAARRQLEEAATVARAFRDDDIIDRIATALLEVQDLRGRIAARRSCP